MKKTMTLLCAFTMLFSTIVVPFSVNASTTSEETSSGSDYEYFYEVTPDAYLIGDDGVIYCTNKYNYIIEEYEADPGTCDKTALLNGLLDMYPEASFAVQMETAIWSDSFSSDDDVVAWLKENGVLVANTMYNPPCDIYAVLTAEQLANFPIHEELGFKMGLAPETVETETPAEDESLKHTFEGDPIASMEECDRILEQFEGKYAIDDDGVFYSTVEYGDYFIEQYEANPGTYDRTFLLRALLYKYPEASFVVQMESYMVEKFYDYVEVAREIETNWLKEHGIEIVYTSADMMNIYAILTADQLADFPAHEAFGYKMGLAPKLDSPTLPDPTLLGDANADDDFGLVDVVCLQRYLIGQVEMDSTQLANSDLTRDAKVNGFDLVSMKKMYLEG